jgi:hypothetical protein
VKSMNRVIIFFVNANMRSAMNHAIMYVSAFLANASLIFGSSMVAFAKPYVTSDWNIKFAKTLDRNILLIYTRKLIYFFKSA